MSDQKRSSGESFAGNVMKYSVATYLGFAITGLALIVKGLLPAEVLGAPVTFMTYTATIMNIGILGLDQALLRFYHEPPAGAEPRQLFAACTRISAAFMMLLGAAGSVFFAQPLAAAFGLGSAGPGIVPLLFLNAALYMLVRYLNVLLRLENDLRAYTAETLWMQGCYNLFYLLPGFFTSNVFVLAVAAILSFGVVAIAFGYKYRAAVFAPRRRFCSACPAASAFRSSATPAARTPRACLPSATAWRSSSRPFRRAFPPTGGPTSTAITATSKSASAACMTC